MKVLKMVRNGLVGLCALGSVLAGTNGFYVPTFRGEAGAQAGYWENFSVPVGAPGNLANFGNNTTSVLTQTQPGAIIAGGAVGNIYNMPNASAFTLSYSGVDPLGLVVLQARTAGTELAYDSVLLDYGTGTLPTSRTELDRADFG